MKLREFIFLLSTALFLISCSDGSTVVEPFSNNPEFSSKIIGNWDFGSSKLTFTKYGDFTSTYKSLSFESTVTQSGKYEIVDSVLILKTAKWVFSNPENIVSISIIPMYYEINFINDELTLKPVRVFTKEEDNKTNLLGNWKMIEWVYHKVSSPKLIEYVGRQEVFYNFISQDSLYYGWNYLDAVQWDNPSWKINYEYNPPDITIPGPGIYNTVVKFKNGKMYWYDKSSLSKYFRDK